MELTHVGPFGGRVRLGPFEAGLNVLAAPNETGKTTAFRAAARALFDRHTTKGEEIRELQPVGTGLGPRVAVEFGVGVERYRIEKTFLVAPVSLLKRWRDGGWQTLADGDAADQRVQSLLQSTLPGRGVTRPEHWGMLGFLWARQGEPADWPVFGEDLHGQALRARLARVELDPVIERVCLRLGEMAGDEMTLRGLPRVGGAWAEAQREWEDLKSRIEIVQKARAEMEVAHERFLRASEQVTQLEKEQQEQARVADGLAKQIVAAERIRAELEVLEAALESARSRLKRVTEDVGLRSGRMTESRMVGENLVRAEGTVKEQQLRRDSLRLAMEQAGQEQRTAAGGLRELRSRRERIRELLRLRRLEAEVTVLERRFGEAVRAGATLASLEERRAKVPVINVARLRGLEALEEALRGHRAALQALGITVELQPDQSMDVEIREGSTVVRQSLAGGQTVRIQRPHSVDLMLPGWGRVAVHSGAKEAAEAAERARETELELARELEAGGVPTVQAAREAMAMGRELDAEIRLARAGLETVTGQDRGLEELGGERDRAVQKRDALLGMLAPVAAELAMGLGELEASEAALSEAVPVSEKLLGEVQVRMEGLGREERAATEQLTAAERVASEGRVRIGVLEGQLADLLGRYPEGMEAALAGVQMGFVEAEARARTARAALPADFEKLPDWNRRAAAALQQIAEALQAQWTARDHSRGVLEMLGGQGLHALETGLEEQLEEVQARMESVRTNAWAARVVHDLILRRRQEATRAVLAPLEDRLTVAFGELTGVRGRRVFLDERLQLAGVGVSREEMHAFGLLSQGAREQLLLCLRIAVAEELAVNEPQVLILDDVLVNTDGTRQQRVLDLLSAIAVRLQVVVLTCHPERFRGAGRLLAFSPG
jgi:uncharacterized protein YhaN